eukprot:55873_1
MDKFLMGVFSTTKHESFECHFCCKTTSSPRLHSKGWICPDPLCAQYNGFTENGDYNPNNILNELNSRDHPYTYCKPSNLPFHHITTNVFQSTTQFTPNTYIATSSDAPLCNKCQQNQRIIQKKLRRFDAGINSNYDAYSQYRRLLERNYPMCNHCKTQCQYRLNTINHNARLWQNYEDSLSPPDLSAFEMKSKSSDTTHSDCISLFMRCIVHLIVMYLSFFISMIGVSNACDSYLSTPFDMIARNQCQIGIGFIRCHDVTTQYNKQCLYVHYIKNISHHDHVLLSMVLLFFVFMSYDKKKHTYIWYILSILSLIVVVLIALCRVLGYDVYNGIDIGLQIGMFVFCLLFVMSSKAKSKHKNMYNNVESAPSLLSLLEQQEMEEKKAITVKRSKRTVHSRNNEYINRKPSGVQHEPMDICSPPHAMNTTQNCFNYVHKGIHSLDLNRSF